VDDIHQRMGGELHLAVFDKTASNPEARIAQAVALFRAQAPEVALNLHVGSLNLIERGVMDGQFQLGIIPEHRRSDSLAYDELFGETMLLYCGAAHPLFAADGSDAQLGAACAPTTSPVWATTRQTWRSPTASACAATPPVSTRSPWPR
jgi:DNA-binding transcriptional LysR family regulator